MPSPIVDDRRPTMNCRRKRDASLGGASQPHRGWDEHTEGPCPEVNTQNGLGQRALES